MNRRRRIHPVLRGVAIVIAVVGLAMVIGELTLQRPHWSFIGTGVLLACLFIYSGISGRSPWFWN